MYLEGSMRLAIDGVTYERITVPRKGSAKPAREKKSTGLATQISRITRGDMRPTS